MIEDTYEELIDGKIDTYECVIIAKELIAEVRRLREELRLQREATNRAVDWHLDYIEGTSGSADEFLDHVEGENCKGADE
tara:strand:+ start:1176 stop:1415 length:240 start_codon:yes stop_codon:yes gene_type:complete